MRTGGNHGVRRGPDLKPRTRTSKTGRRRDWQRTPTYNSWAQMRSRCNNPNHPRWADWGGRGITVCERWASYENFLADMGERPPGTTLERNGNDGNYEPDNCSWATPAQQARNQRSTKLTPEKIREIVGLAELPVSEVAKRVKIDRHVVGVVLFTARTLQQYVTVPPEQYLRRLDNVERMAEHETEPESYHAGEQVYPS